MTAASEGVDAIRPVPRIGLLDTIRGAALIAMASYHFTWDMEFMGYLTAGTAESGWLRIYARAIASSFLFLAGFSLVLANTPSLRLRPFLKRLGMIAAAALAISIATRIAMPDGWIFFGILHCMAAASVVGLVFLRMPFPVPLIAGIAAIAAPQYLRSEMFDAPWFWWLGLSQNPQPSNDYVPLLPWLGPFLIGLSLAKIAIWQNWLDGLAALGGRFNPLARIGRHSLAFYLIHQPVLIAIAYGLTFVAPPAKPDPVATYLRQCQTSCTGQASDALCRSFCECTLEDLQDQSLFEPLQSGAIHADKDERIQRIARECSAVAQ